jgi:protein-disulfide isomerase
MEGLPTAKRVLIEFSDFECPYCGKYFNDIYPQLRRDYIATGRLRHVFRNMPLAIHQFALDAAKAADCAGRQNRYWEMYSELFRHQHTLAPADVRRYAATVGLESSQFSDCLNARTTADRLDADQAEATRLAVEGTPTFFVGEIQSSGAAKLLRRLNGVRSYSAFVAALER